MNGSEREIKADIEATRAELAASVDELTTRLNRAAQESKHLAIRIGGVLAAAVFVTLLVRRARR